MLQEVLPLFKSFKALSLSLSFSQSLLSDGALLSMSGKSTYLKQVGLLTVQAMIGCL